MYDSVYLRVSAIVVSNIASTLYTAHFQAQRIVLFLTVNKNKTCFVFIFRENPIGSFF